jgi:hypothetical protein
LFTGTSGTTASTTNDTANATYTFTPSNNINGYVATKTSTTAFPTNPTGETSLTLTDDSFATVTLTGSNKVLLYGTDYSTFYAGSNGYIIFTSGDETFYNTTDTAATILGYHFSQPRISALFYDLNPERGTPTISWKELSDRVPVTWKNVRGTSGTSTSNFQIEMFFDGRIQTTILGLGTTRGLVGLSKVTAMPSGYVKSDFSAFPTPIAPSGLVVTGGSKSVALSWNAASGASGYWVKRSSVSGGPYANVGLTSSTSYMDPGLAR